MSLIAPVTITPLHLIPSRKKKKMKESIVLFPSPSSHHMVSMVELGKLILKYHSNYSIIILVPSTPLNTTNTCSYINPSISFHFLPPIAFLQTSTKEEIAFQSIILNLPNVHHALETISLTCRIVCFITSSIGLHLSTQPTTTNTFPTYTYFTSGASALAAILHLPTLHAQTTLSFKDFPPNSLLNIPGLPPIKPSFMPQPLLDRHQPAYNFFLDYTASLVKSDGIIVNTYDFLEPQAIKAVVNGDCVRDAPTPPLYCIGPLTVESKDRAAPDGELDHVTSSCLTWLDAQPCRSVVLLCFGSKPGGAFCVQQLKEIATGLERSDQRFLWVVKNPPYSNTEVELESVLPAGFLEKNKEKGMVVKSWAPQAEILSHKSVGGFVTHCGWNSVLEGVSNGVPMIAWPLYAEQLINSTVLVEEMKVAIPITNRLGEEVMVSAEEVEKKTRELMGVEGNGLRESCLKMREMGMAAWITCNGASSFTAFSNLVASWNNH